MPQHLPAQGEIGSSPSSPKTKNKKPHWQRAWREKALPGTAGWRWAAGSQSCWNQQELLCLQNGPGAGFPEQLCWKCRWPPVETSIQTCLVAFICLNANQISIWACSVSWWGLGSAEAEELISALRTWCCSAVGEAASPTSPVPAASSARHQVDGGSARPGLPGKRTARAGRGAHRSAQPQSSESLKASTCTSFPVTYLSRTVALVLVREPFGELNLYALYLFSPKITKDIPQS